MMESFLGIFGGWVYVIIVLGVMISLGFLGDLKHRYTMLSFQLEEIKDTQSRILDLLFEIEKQVDERKD